MDDYDLRPGTMRPEEYDPEPIEEKRPEQTIVHKPEVISVGHPKHWKRVTKQYCEVHNLVDDESETEFKAVKCTNCPYGALVERIAPIE